MATDLTKMVEDLVDEGTLGNINLYPLFKAMAAEIEANREKIERLKIKRSG